MTRTVSFAGVFLLLGVAVGCAGSEATAAPTDEDALGSALPPAALITSSLESGLSYGERIGFTYTKGQTQLGSGYAFATKLQSQAQDTLVVRLTPGSTGGLYLVDRTNGRYLSVASKMVSAPGQRIELSYFVPGSVSLWAVFVPTFAGAATYATSAIQLLVNSGAPWTPALAIAVRESLVGADVAARPWAKTVASSDVSLLPNAQLTGVAKERYAQLLAVKGQTPQVFRWIFLNREYHVIQGTHLLDGTLDVYITNGQSLGRWVTGARLHRDDVNKNISSGFLEWVDQ